MKILYENQEIEDFILKRIASNKPYVKFLSNAKLCNDLDKVMRTLSVVSCCNELNNFRSLNYEQLKYGLRGISSVRIGYKSKFRLLFEEDGERITIKIIEISEHYGDK